MHCAGSRAAELVRAGDIKRCNDELTFDFAC
jgi:hypothetical protein